MRDIAQEIAKRATDPKEKAQAERDYKELINVAAKISPEVMARFEPPMAASIDAESRASATDKFERGKKVAIQPGVVARIHSAIAPDLKLLPTGVRAGVIEQIAPFKGFDGHGMVRVYMKDAEGQTFYEDRPWGELLNIRAGYFPGSKAVGFFRFDLAGSSDKVFRGELRHEAVHALRRSGLIDDVTLDRLASHADDLALLDMSLKDYLYYITSGSRNGTDCSTQKNL